MSDGFILDTSGAVPMPSAHSGTVPFRWGGLSPFAQGYVKALFAGLTVDDLAGWLDGVDPYRAPGFSDLSPEALALILRNCEAYRRVEWPLAAQPDASVGAAFWRERNAAARHPSVKNFPPLTPRLSDEGKVCLQKGRQ